ncbi:hypothetical protein QQ045_029187 [Rhodiola kirilowii]
MFCTSESATAICTSSSEQHVVSSSAIIRLGSGRAIDRHNPIIITQGSRRSLSSSSDSAKKQPAASRSAPKSDAATASRKSTSLSDQAASAGRKSCASLVDSVRKSSCIKPSAYFTPHDSTRYLLRKEPDRQPALAPAESKNFVTADHSKAEAGGEKLVRSSSLKNEAPLFFPSSDNKYYSPFRINSDQVVVVRVSLHCKGCAGKVKKHISRLEGVTSYKVDFDEKKVIVVGDVTPLEVLASISKVRTAQLLPSEKPNATLAPSTEDRKQVIADC